MKQRRLLAVPGPFAYHKTILVNKWWGKTIRKNRFLQYCSLCRKHWTKQPFDESCSWRQRSAFILFQVVSTFKWFCFKSFFSMNVHFFLLNVHIYMNVLYIDVYICIFFLLVIYILPSSGVCLIPESQQRPVAAPSHLQLIEPGLLLPADVGIISFCFRLLPVWPDLAVGSSSSGQSDTHSRSSICFIK